MLGGPQNAYRPWCLCRCLHKKHHRVQGRRKLLRRYAMVPSASPVHNQWRVLRTRIGALPAVGCQAMVSVTNVDRPPVRVVLQHAELLVILLGKRALCVASDLRHDLQHVRFRHLRLSDALHNSIVT